MIRLDEKYNRDDFIAFLSNAFFADFTRDIRPIHTQNLSAIEKAYSLGKSNKLDLQIFEFEYAGSSKKRVALTKEAFKIMQDSLSYQALAIFHGKENDDWRLSLMILNPKKTDTGKVSISYSNPRRYSYFLGPNAKINTPHRFLIKAGQIKDFDDLQSRFNVEIVTKEFFENYKKLFDRLLAYLQKDHAFQAFANNNGINTANFAKKLLGQIVFLYFLQRKGWLGAKKGDSVSQGDKNFIRALFNQSREKGVNFYNTYLEPLFYGALNKPAEKAASYYRDYFDSQIPFLNGGLFEPPQNYDWEKSFLHIPDKVFSKDPKNPEHGDGILDIFDMYNFTVDESDFLDKEVSVDPEMLGKVFENLLEENLRKGKGTYYTPREIVNYMCEESLVNFLATETNLAPDDVKNKYFPAYNILGDEKIEARDVATSEQIIESLKGIKVVDPACGSGAFLVGMLQQITHLRHELEIRSQILGKRTTASSEYEIKKDTIQNCIHGVDIDPGAIEIAKLRLWLSLVVDYELEEIEPLPNLDYKIMQGNSLLEELVLGDTIIKLYDSTIIKKTSGSKRMQNLFEEETRVGLFDDEKETVLKTMKILQAEYFKTSDSKNKTRLKDLIDKVEHELIEKSVKTAAQELHNEKINIKTIPGIGHRPEDAKKLERISNRESQIFAILEELKRTGTKPFFLWHLYFADVFSNNGGFDVVIANPPYEEISNQVDKKIFQKLYSQVLSGHYDLYIFFFKIALDIIRPNGIISLITPHTYIHYPQFKNLRNWIYTNGEILEITNRISGIFDSAIVDNSLILLKAHPIHQKSKTRFESKKIENEKLITESSVSLHNNEFDSSNFDINAIKNKKIFERFTKKTKPLGEITESSQGITVYAKLQGEKKNWFRDKKVDEDSKPFIKGRNIFKYVLEWNSEFIQYGKWLWCPRDPKYFESPKIFLRQTSDKLIGTYIHYPLYCIDSVHSIINKEGQSYDLKYILAILNSSLGSYLYKLLITETGKVFAQVKLTFLRQIPIKETNMSEQEPFIEIVNKILTLTMLEDFMNDTDSQTRVKEYVKHIDQMVYQLYNLSDEEINMIESYGNNK